MPWTFTLNAGVTYLRQFGNAEFRAKLAVYNLFNSQDTTAVDQYLQNDISDATNPTFRQPLGFQSPRFAQLTVSLSF